MWLNFLPCPSIWLKFTSHTVRYAIASSVTYSEILQNCFNSAAEGQQAEHSQKKLHNDYYDYYYLGSFFQKDLIEISSNPPQWISIEIVVFQKISLQCLADKETLSKTLL